LQISGIRYSCSPTRPTNEKNCRAQATTHTKLWSMEGPYVVRESAHIRLVRRCCMLDIHACQYQNRGVRTWELQNARNRSSGWISSHPAKFANLNWNSSYHICKRFAPNRFWTGCESVFREVKRANLISYFNSL
jgi:hypothetical protein